MAARSCRRVKGKQVRVLHDLVTVIEERNAFRGYCGATELIGKAALRVDT